MRIDPKEELNQLCIVDFSNCGGPSRVRLAQQRQGSMLPTVDIHTPVVCDACYLVGTRPPGLGGLRYTGHLHGIVIVAQGLEHDTGSRSERLVDCVWQDCDDNGVGVVGARGSANYGVAECVDGCSGLVGICYCCSSIWYTFSGLNGSSGGLDTPLLGAARYLCLAVCDSEVHVSRVAYSFHLPHGATSAM
jgi:hypothetical protein